MRFLVTDADNRAALSIVRSLGRQGMEVFVAHHAAHGLALASRYVGGLYRVPDARSDPEGFAEAVVELSRSAAIDAVIPVSDVTTLSLARAAERPNAELRLCQPRLKSLELAADKLATLRLADSLGVPTPVTEVIESAERIPSGLRYPVVLKPARSRVWADGSWAFGQVTYATDAEDLQRQLEALAPALFPVLLQERIDGEGIGVFLCYDGGRPLAQFSHRRLREKPPSGGVSVLRESIAVDPAAGLQARQLLEALDWHGVAMVEFKRDLRDGRLKLMEINGRFWGSLQLAIDAGVDFPGLVARILAGEHPEPVSDYRLGVRTRWLLGDFDALLAVLLKPRSALKLPPQHPGRLRTLVDFLHLFGRDLHYETMTREDPGPGLYELRRWLGLKS
jgi:predicted ATP-grasp superfamily ATP-dependent carboligase